MSLKIFFFPISLILSLSIAIWFVKPELVEYKIKKNNLVEALDEKQQVEKGLRSLNMAMDDYKDMKNDSKQLILNAVPKQKNNDDFVEEINKNAVSSGVLITEIKIKEACERNHPSNANEKEKIFMMANGASVSVQVVGDYLKVKSFIEKIDAENRMSIPTKIVISSFDDVRGSSDVTDGEVENADIQQELIEGKIFFAILSAQEKEASQVEASGNLDDEITHSLLSVGLKSQVVENYQNMVTSALFKPHFVQNAGKQNLFEK